MRPVAVCAKGSTKSVRRSHEALPIRSSMAASRVCMYGRAKPELPQTDTARLRTVSTSDVVRWNVLLEHRRRQRVRAVPPVSKDRTVAAAATDPQDRIQAWRHAKWARTLFHGHGHL